MSVQRSSMIDGQLRPNKVTNEAVLASLASVPRENFVAPNMAGVAYVDEDLPISASRSLMEPMVFSRLLEAAAPQASDTALVVASGSGYAACVLGGLCASAVGLESDGLLVDHARAQATALEASNVEFVIADVTRCDGVAGPISLLLVGGAVSDATLVAEAFSPILSDDARLLVVERANPMVPGLALRLSRDGGGWQRQVLFDASVPLLPEFTAAPSFRF